MNLEGCWLQGIEKDGCARMAENVENVKNLFRVGDGRNEGSPQVARAAAAESRKSHDATNSRSRDPAVFSILSKL